MTVFTRYEVWVGCEIHIWISVRRRIHAYHADLTARGTLNRQSRTEGHVSGQHDKNEIKVVQLAVTY
jgi:hypothetical protein